MIAADENDGGEQEGSFDHGIVTEQVHPGHEHGQEHLRSLGL